MGLNIKNPRTHALVRRLAEETGATQTRAVEVAAADHLRRIDEDRAQPGTAARATAILQVASGYRRRLADEDRTRLARGTDELYDDAGLPR
ncbi:MAG: type II toxin-antitoxin system VapB family antitoxin [Bifidobacteriaceae bacterium]|nr:type II toxin-antitoxin system VapB family antitoxin [Bifidobacteriaceae bacterium]